MGVLETACWIVTNGGQRHGRLHTKQLCQADHVTGATLVDGVGGFAGQKQALATFGVAYNVSHIG